MTTLRSDSCQTSLLRRPRPNQRRRRYLRLQLWIVPSDHPEYLLVFAYIHTLFHLLPGRVLPDFLEPIVEKGFHSLGFTP